MARAGARERGRPPHHCAATHLPEEEARSVVTPQEGRCAGARRCALRRHRRSHPVKQRQEAERHEDGPEEKEGPKVGLESARLVVPRRAAVARERLVGEQVANARLCRVVVAKGLTQLRVKDVARDGVKHEVEDKDRQVEEATK